ncbi:sugar nucleotide-binding protein [Streptacidiphilus sp. EB103A]|uniref:sugar nucleotide-binding protein n=1 Tax=Streptacidiphilus sp. EB103A TaxID=3156275 RepID=UPI00351518C2
MGSGFVGRAIAARVEQHGRTAVLAPRRQLIAAPENPQRAGDLHSAVAANLAACGRRLVLISTDNVFDGSSADNDEASPGAPTNAYGRAKVAAERTIQACAASTVLRVRLGVPAIGSPV